ncbi:uncharacterized protein VNE69_10020 [Vairimorpha necatrix]|uniref:Uncharacterized protein n=1 Tax=Vairimorpha necatrix TaxID=6039 RepID=A0AAX4JF89_9MICR
MNFLKSQTIDNYAKPKLCALIVLLTIQLLITINVYLLIISVCILIWITKYKLFCFIMIALVYSFKYDLLFISPNKPFGKRDNYKVNYEEELNLFDQRNVENKNALDTIDGSTAIGSPIVVKNIRAKKRYHLNLIFDGEDDSTIIGHNGEYVYTEETTTSVKQ